MDLFVSLAIIVIIPTALGLMMGIVKPADAPKHIGAILSVVIVLTLIPDVLMSDRSIISLWQRPALAAI
jgi:hypothetical protein